METISVRTSQREEMIDITSDVENILDANEIDRGVCLVFTQHTTCSITVNENADPDVQTDMLGFLKRLIPQDETHFKHGEQNSDAHLKSSLFGSSVTIPFENGKLLLGRWQAIYMCEFDGPRERMVIVSIMAETRQ